MRQEQQQNELCTRTSACPALIPDDLMTDLTGVGMLEYLGLKCMAPGV